MLLSISELKYDHQNSNCLPYIIWRQSTTYVDHWRPLTFDLRLYNVNSVQVICNYGDIHGISQDITLFDDGSLTHLIMDIVVFRGLMELNRENRGIQRTNQGRS